MPIENPAIVKLFSDLLGSAALSKLDPKWGNAGFPIFMQEAFVQTANQLATAQGQSNILMSRVPGKACNQLIKEKYDLKGFFVKSKSCNWGPMAGFICRNLAFNKKGANGRDFNEKYFLWYQEQLEQRFNLKQGDINAFQLKSFVPIKISADQKKNVIANNLEQDFIKIEPNLVYGLAFDLYDKAGNNNATKFKNTTVITEFLMKQGTEKDDKDQFVWELYHGQVFCKELNADPTKPYQPYPANKLPSPVTETPLTATVVDQLLRTNKTAIETNLTAFWGKLKVTLSATTRKWYTIDAAMNPLVYRPYKTDKSKYKNAITGDYDLFAVWPARPEADTAGLRRVSEILAGPELLNTEYPDFNLASYNTNKNKALVVEVAGKNYSLELTRSRNVFIEFILPGKDLGKFESDYYGNINDIVAVAAQTLNSYLMGGSEESLPNAAFHSDEGGRPEVNEIEYPIAAFIPEKLALQVKKANKKIYCASYLIESHTQLLSLIELAIGDYYIPLNAGWLVHWFVLIHTEAEINAAIATVNSNSSLTPKDKGELSNYFTKRIEEIQVLKGKNIVGDGGQTMSELEFIKKRITGLFTRKPYTSSSAPQSVNDLVTALQTGVDSDFNKIKSIFLQLATKAKTPEQALGEIFKAENTPVAP